MIPSISLTIGLDADDTLWHNENIFAQVHERYRALLASYHPADVVDATLLATERRNLDSYGYGIKGFTLSAIETAIQLTGEKIGASELHKILQLGREMHEHPVDLLGGVAEIVRGLATEFPLLLITKGDLRDQERKLRKSGLRECFSGVEIVSEKDETTYRTILERHGIAPANFFMIGNSLKSDILPVLALGGSGAHVPYPILWALEEAVAPTISAHRFSRLKILVRFPRPFGSGRPAAGARQRIDLICHAVGLGNAAGGHAAHNLAGRAWPSAAPLTSIDPNALGR